MPTIEVTQAWYTTDPVHGFDHILRVYQMAEKLAAIEGADLEIVRAAVLLHDVDTSLIQASSGDQNRNANGHREGHHFASAEFARMILRDEGWPEERIVAVQHCIRAHRFRDEREQPQTLEAKVVFDADKLDAIGAIGVARAIAYSIQNNQPIFSQPSGQFSQTGRKLPGEAHSAYHEFIYKLINLKDRLYTNSARTIAEERHRFMVDFYNRLRAELDGEE